MRHELQARGAEKLEIGEDGCFSKFFVRCFPSVWRPFFPLRKEVHKVHAKMRNEKSANSFAKKEMK